ncbi:hypothetical protein V1477_012257 [Vespula maculifrons]|uniref:Uncharacterized protein n=1 Tax=Vespula maculifrons TaxID=7453 RepID=A0ABD2BWZ1_VESMC
MKIPPGLRVAVFANENRLYGERKHQPSNGCLALMSPTKFLAQADAKKNVHKSVPASEEALLAKRTDKFMKERRAILKGDRCCMVVVMEEEEGERMKRVSSRFHHLVSIPSKENESTKGYEGIRDYSP